MNLVLRMRRYSAGGQNRGGGRSNMVYELRGLTAMPDSPNLFCLLLLFVMLVLLHYTLYVSLVLTHTVIK
jgi:hypothetical protein